MLCEFFLEDLRISSAILAIVQKASNEHFQVPGPLIFASLGPW